MSGTTMEQVAPYGHGTSGLAIVLAWSGVLTPILTVLATMASLMWFAICVWESKTIQHWKNNWLMKRHARKLMRLKAKAITTAAAIDALEAERHGRVAAREIVADAAATAAKIVAQPPKS